MCIALFGLALGQPLPMIFVRGQIPITLRNQHHTVLELRPGVYWIDTRHGENWSAGQEDSKTISVEGGCRYYVRTQAETHFHPLYFLLAAVFQVSAFPFVDSDFPIEFMEEDKALPELRETLYQPSERAGGDRRTCFLEWLGNELCQEQFVILVASEASPQRDRLTTRRARKRS